MYENPIQGEFGEIQTKIIEAQENYIMQMVQDYGVTVDKEELIKALQYDRQQYEKGYADAKEEMGWIPCSERLPEYGEDVLITDEWGVYIARCYNLSRNREEPQASWWYGDANEYRTHPLAWMPLPEPYKGEQE